MQEIESLFSPTNLLHEAHKFLKSAPRKGCRIQKEAASLCGNLAETLAMLSMEVQAGQYRFHYRGALIPKGNGESRGITILSGTDYIVHSLLLQYLHDKVRYLVDTKVSCCKPSYKKESTPGGPVAASNLIACVRTVASCAQENCCAVTTDIENFFGTMDREVLIKHLDELQIDHKLKMLVYSAMFTTPTPPQGATPDQILKYWNPSLGVVQGSPLSPLMANIYLSSFDQKLEATHAFRYVDDILLVASDEDAVLRMRERAFDALDELKLSYAKVEGLSKYQQVAPGEPFKFLGLMFTRERIDLPEAALRRFQSRLSQFGAPENHRGRRPSELEPALDAMVRLTRYVRGWHGYYRLAHPTRKVRKTLADSVWKSARSALIEYGRGEMYKLRLDPLLPDLTKMKWNTSIEGVTQALPPLAEAVDTGELSSDFVEERLEEVLEVDDAYEAR